MVNNWIPDSMGKDGEKACQSICPLHNVFISKEKTWKQPKLHWGKLMEPLEDSRKATGGETGTNVKQTDGYEPPDQESV